MSVEIRLLGGFEVAVRRRAVAAGGVDAPARRRRW